MRAIPKSQDEIAYERYCDNTVRIYGQKPMDFRSWLRSTASISSSQNCQTICARNRQGTAQ